MCGIVGLHLREPALYPRLGELLTMIVGQLADRGPDSAGMAIYGDPTWSPDGHSTVTLLKSPVPATEVAMTLTAAPAARSRASTSPRRPSCMPRLTTNPSPLQRESPHQGPGSSASGPT